MKFCVWVLEVAVLAAKQDRILWWEVWEAFNTRSEAVAARRKGEKGKFGALMKKCQRIRKYIPERP